MSADDYSVCLTHGRLRGFSYCPECAAAGRPWTKREAAYARALGIERARLAATRTALGQLQDAILWALGERGDFGEEPPPLHGRWRARYWWRIELRNRAGVALASATKDHTA